MARVGKENLALNNRLDELERRMFVLKLQYEKYFSGLERVEPIRERDEIRRFLHDLMQEPITNGRQRFKFQNLRARFTSLEMYLTRNLVMIERGTHPKMKFRASVKERQRAEQESLRAKVAARQERQLTPEEREDRAYTKIFDSYIEARRQCGQSTDMDYEAVKNTLKKQVRMIKSQYRCDSVKFRVTVEDGKARLKAVPKRS
jgi:hypothetical protein